MIEASIMAKIMIFELLVLRRKFINDFFLYSRTKRKNPHLQSLILLVRLFLFDKSYIIINQELQIFIHILIIIIYIR